jgi:hypothetical protein
MPTARCESCKSSFEIEGTSAVCPVCGKNVEADLSIRVVCSCGTTLKAPPKMRGRVITCPRCTHPVPIPRGNEAEEAKSTVQVGHKTRWVFALALLPIFVALQGERDDPRRRIDRSLASAKVDGSNARTLAEKVSLIPSKRAERAAAPQGSPMPWIYGAAGFALVFAFLWLSFGTPTLGSVEMIQGVAVMAVAGLALGFLLNLALPAPADAASAPRLLIGAILGAAGAELLKSAWIVFRRGKLPRRALLLLGLAVGAGFGLGYAIMAAAATSGYALARSYWTECITIVALQSVWAGTAALFIARADKSRASKASKMFAAALPTMGLNAAFYFFHQQQMYLASLLVGLASFALFHALHYWTEETETETIAGETIRL